MSSYWLQFRAIYPFQGFEDIRVTSHFLGRETKMKIKVLLQSLRKVIYFFLNFYPVCMHVFSLLI